MNEIEKLAMRICNNHCADLEETVRNSQGNECFDRLSNLLSAYKLLATALQEKAERDKGCEYCKGKSYRDRKLIPACYSHTPAKIVIDTDNALYISNEAIDISINTIKINYCPMCGRKLKEEN